MSDVFDAGCKRCPRLSAFLGQVKSRHPGYHCAPVPAFGVHAPRVLIVGLAPGMHGANATGRPFTGDYAGVLLYETLYELGMSSAPQSLHAKDNLVLHDCRITNAVKCLPPENKPVGAEINNCNAFLAAELALLEPGAVVLALGGIAHKAVIKARGLKQSGYKFAHGAEHGLDAGLTLVDSYHCSRYNTQTRRLTPEMFEAVMAKAKQLANTDVRGSRASAV